MIVGLFNLYVISCAVEVSKVQARNGFRIRWFFLALFQMFGIGVFLIILAHIALIADEDRNFVFALVMILHFLVWRKLLRERFAIAKPGLEDKR